MRVDDIPKNASRCKCPGCPTHNDCMKADDARLFCSRGETPCKPEPKGCLCGECPVWAHYGLASFYFCLDGAAD